MFDGILDDVNRFAFFKLIFDFLDDEIATFRDNLMGNLMVWVVAIALVALTLWILFQGYLVATGRSRESAMGLVVNSMRATLIVSVAASMGVSGVPLYGFFTDSLPTEINKLVTNSDDPPADKIDDNLALMSATLTGLDALNVNGMMTLKEDADKAKLMATVGVAGPSLVAGSMMLLYKVALALFVGLGPLFILSLLFEQTKSFFSKWLFYGIGTMFSFSVLCFMVAVSMKLVAAAAAAFAVQYAAMLALSDPGTAIEGVSSMAMQQGGIGLILTTLILTCPPMAAMFFQGTLGNFTAYSMMGAQLNGNAAPPNHQQQGYRPSQGPSSAVPDSTVPNSGVGSRVTGFNNSKIDDSSTVDVSGARGLAAKGGDR